MTTNQSSTNAFKYTYKSGLKGMPILPAIANFFVLAFLVTFFVSEKLLSRDPVTNSDGNIIGYSGAGENYFSLFFIDSEYMLTPCLVLIALAGLAMAICSFNFITSKKQVNIFYSLGITRTKLFLGKYLSGATLLTISTFIPLFLTLIINLSTLGFSGIIFKSFFLYLFSFLAVGISAFTITATVFSCVGTIFEAGIFSGITLFLPDIILFGIQSIMSKFLYGNPYGANFVPVNNNVWDDSYVATLSEQFEFLSPVFFMKRELSQFAFIRKQEASEGVKQVIENPSFTNIFLWVIIIAVIAFLGVTLFNKRKAEIAGFIGTNRILNTFVSFLAGFFVFTFSVANSKEVAKGILIGAILFTIVHLGLELAVLRDLKKFVKGLYKLPVGLVTVGIFVATMNTGLFGFLQKIPAENRIKSVAVTIVGETTQYGLFGEGDRWSSDNNLQFTPALNAITGELTSAEDISSALEVHKILIETDESERTLNNTIQFLYTLKDGSVFKRNFENVSPEAYKAVLYLEESDYFKNAMNTLFKGEIKMPDPKNGITLSTSEEAISNAQYALRNNNSTLNIYSKYLDSFYFCTLSEKDREKLLTALYNDLNNRSVTEKYYPDQSPVAFMKFEGDFYTEYWAILEKTESAEGGEAVEETLPKKPVTSFSLADFSSDKVELFTSSFYNPQPFFVITTDMTETIKVLKDFKIYNELTKTPDFVSAKILPTADCYEGTYGKEDYIEKYFSRYFITTYTSTSYTAVDENGNAVPDSWERYSDTIDRQFDGYVTSEQKDVDKLLKYAYTAFEQDNTDEGYFVTFYTSNGDTSLCFIPENKLPSEFRIKF